MKLTLTKDPKVQTYVRVCDGIVEVEGERRLNSRRKEIEVEGRRRVPLILLLILITTQV